MNNERRSFMIAAAAGGVALAAGQSAFAQTAPVAVDVNDPQAKALAYVADAAQVDKQKNPGFAVGQNCENCQLYQGMGKEVLGPCPLFPNKVVAAKGWCVAWVKKA